MYFKDSINMIKNNILQMFETIITERNNKIIIEKEFKVTHTLKSIRANHWKDTFVSIAGTVAAINRDENPAQILLLDYFDVDTFDMISVTKNNPVLKNLHKGMLVGIKGYVVSDTNDVSIYPEGNPIIYGIQIYIPNDLSEIMFVN